MAAQRLVSQQKSMASATGFEHWKEAGVAGVAGVQELQGVAGVAELQEDPLP